MLLILAGVTVATLTGDNGLLTKAGEAKNTNSEEEGLERIKLAVMASHDENGLNTASLAKNLSQINGVTDTNNQVISKNTEITLPKTLKLNDFKYKIKKDGTVIINNQILPDKYEQVLYLEANGKQYLNTTFVADEQTNVEYKMSIKGFKWLGPHLLSSRSDFFPFYRLMTRTVYVMRPGHSISIDMDLIKDTIYEYKFWDNNIYINGEIIGTTGKVSKSSNNDSLYLLTYGGDPNNSDYTIEEKVYYCKIYNNNDLKRNFIPCDSTTTVTDLDGIQRSEGTVGIYDTVTGQFYTNKGTGTFGYETQDGTYVAPTNN